MFLAPSSSRAVDPYLQTLLLRVSLSRLGGKHRQLPRQVGDSVSSMTTFAFSTMTPPRGATFIFGSWVCVANGSGGFNSHLTNSPTPKIPTSEDSNKIARSCNRGVTFLPTTSPRRSSRNSKTSRVLLGLRSISDRILLGLRLLLRNPSLVCAIHRLFTNR